MSKDICKILSPVGSESVLKVAVKCGADSVYLSGKSYGARGFADNFTREELVDAVKYCHERNVEVFVTVNTSILEDEIVDVVDYVYFLYSIGVDAVIIEDLGLAGIIHDVFGSLSIHASTQMTVYDYSFVKWLCDNGYASVNLSREVPLSRIKNITSKLDKYGHDIDVEVFGHGALCYCYSGKCLMSSYDGGRSGNRGLCAQPCRKMYTFTDEEGNVLRDKCHLLSTMDLCTIDNTEDFLEAGVDCIKIEGRMKNEEYVAITTYCYKQAVLGNFDDDFRQLLQLTFNRGLTGGYVLGEYCDSVMGRDVSGNKGYPIGRVNNVGRNSISISLSKDNFPMEIVNGDGLKFDCGDDVSGMYVENVFSQDTEKVVVKKKSGIRVKKNCVVYITYSKYLKDKSKSLINKDNMKKIPFDLEINVNNDMEIQLKAYLDNVEKMPTIVGEEKFQTAINKALTKENLTKQLQKTGNTKYRLRKIIYHNFPDNLFMPISQINQVRRQLIKEIEKTHKIQTTQKEKEETESKLKKFKTKHHNQKKNKKLEEKWNACINSIEQAKTIKEHKYINSVYYDGSYNHETIDQYIKNITEELIHVKKILPDKELVWILPQILLDEDLPHIAEILVKLEYEQINTKIQTDNIAIGANLNTEKYANNMNIYNNYTIKQLSREGFTKVTIPNEISYKDMKKLNNTHCQLEYTIFGKIQIMITKDNFNDLTQDLENTHYMIDNDKHKYLIKKDCYNNSHIYDYRIHKLEEKEVQQLRKTNINNYTIDLRFFNKTDTEKILKYYEKIMENNKTGKLELTGNTSFFKANYHKGLYKK